MKKIACILIMVILLSNWVGYALFSTYFENGTDTGFDVSLQQYHYHGSNLLSIKVPRRQFEGNGATQFESANREIKIGDLLYRFVRQCSYDDSIEFLYVPDYSMPRLQSARDEFFNLVNDLLNNGPDKNASSHPHGLKNLLMTYYVDNNPFDLNGLYFSVRKRSAPGYDHILSCYNSTADHPPQHA